LAVQQVITADADVLVKGNSFIKKIIAATKIINTINFARVTYGSPSVSLPDNIIIYLNFEM
jgi:hypothetical protein